MIALQGVYPARDGGVNPGPLLPGEIRMFAGNFAPHGWAFCDGQQLKISQHEQLFAAIGKTYGGDDSGFNLPDLRGRVPVHTGTGPGLAPLKQGDKGGGEKVAAAKDPQTSLRTAWCQGIRYVIALEGVDREVDAPYFGEVRISAAESAPDGWANCDGQILPIGENEALFSLLGTMYGGDGRTTFALPDLRGRSPVHAGRSDETGEVKQGQKSDEHGAAKATEGDKAVATQPYLAVRYFIALQGAYPTRN